MRDLCFGQHLKFSGVKYKLLVSQISNWLQSGSTLLTSVNEMTTPQQSWVWELAVNDYMKAATLGNNHITSCLACREHALIMGFGQSVVGHAGWNYIRVAKITCQVFQFIPVLWCIFKSMKSNYDANYQRSVMLPDNIYLLSCVCSLEDTSAIIKSSQGTKSTKPHG